MLPSVCRSSTCCAEPPTDMDTVPWSAAGIQACTRVVVRSANAEDGVAKLGDLHHIETSTSATAQVQNQVWQRFGLNVEPLSIRKMHDEI